jgi:hypothetical protein
VRAAMESRVESITKMNKAARFQMFSFFHFLLWLFRQYHFGFGLQVEYIWYIIARFLNIIVSAKLRFAQILILFQERK